MKKSLHSIIGTVASSAFIFALTFEGLTGIGANLDANRANVQARVRVSQTSYSGVNEAAVNANMSALDSYNQTVKTERRIYSK